jgi:hypothetical protein
LPTSVVGDSDGELQLLTRVREGQMDQRLVIRPVRVDDDAALGELYDSLDADERYCRFFGATHPRPAFFRDLVTVGERGGARFVAALDGEGPLVGEAGYTLLPNGDGELAVAVAHGWRGQVEAPLLDALFEAAAAAGVANLEADVLTVDVLLLDLLRAREAVVMEHDGWRAVRLLIGTTGMPTWPSGPDAPRVLVETPGHRWHAEETARAAGADVLICGGPDHRADGCPAIEGRPCSLAEGADLIVIDDPAGRLPDLMNAHTAVHPDVIVHHEQSSAARG